MANDPRPVTAVTCWNDPHARPLHRAMASWILPGVDARYSRVHDRLRRCQHTGLTANLLEVTSSVFYPARHTGRIF